MKTHKEITLYRLIKSEYLRSIILPILFIELFLVLAYFFSNNYMTKMTQISLINEAKKSVYEISKKATLLLNQEFKQIESLTQIFASEHENFYKNYKIKNFPSNKYLNYYTTQDGVITNTKNDDNACSVFYSNIFKNDKTRMSKAVQTEILDAQYNMILNANENIIQVYLNTHDSLNRLCPFMEDALGQYTHHINIPKYNFYYLADSKHNPNREVVWTNAYLDPAGQGWMVSAIAPVYKDDFLEGVIGLDVTIEKLINNMISLKLIYPSFSMLVDKNGKILAMDTHLEKILGVKELKKHEYKEPIYKTISKPENFNLFGKNSNKLNSFLAKQIKNADSISEYSDQNNSFLITRNNIEQTNWQLITLIEKKEILKASEKLKNKLYNIGFMIIIGMILFYTIFLFFILKRSAKFSKEILVPIEDLIKATDMMQNSLSSSKLGKSNIKELNTLLYNFSNMSTNLKELYDTMNLKITSSIEEIREKDKQLLQQSRFAQMGEMISMIAHQWRQPLSTIAMTINNIKLDIALGEIQEDEIENQTNQIIVQVEYLTKTIDDFRSFFKPDKEKDKTNFSLLIKTTLGVIEESLSVNEIILFREEKSKNEFVTFSHEITQVILNILNNAKDALSTQNKKYIWIKTYDVNNKSYLVIEDNGGGIDTKIIDKIFEPYFSTKDEKNGTGLGLYMSKIIIENHCKGKLHVENTNKGAKFIIEIPN